MSGVIAARVDRLDREGRTVAEIAAVAGSGCSLSLIREVANLSTASIARGVDELLERRIFREAGARSGNDYVFGHHLIADAIYADIEPALREQRHLRIARCLEAAWGSDRTTSPQEIARHYERALVRSSACRWYLQAATSASGMHAHGDAVVLASRALENAESDDETFEALDLRERARSLRGDRDGQREDIDALERLAGAEPQARFDATLRRVLLERSLGNSDAETALIDRLHESSASLGDDARAQAFLQAATHASHCSRAFDVGKSARQALAIYERLGNVRAQLECLNLLVESSSNTGDLAQGQIYLALIQQRAGELNDPRFEAHVLDVAAVAALLRQRYRECYALTQRTVKIHEELNDREAQAASRGRLAITAAWLGDYSFALSEFGAALGIYESLGHERGIALTNTNRTVLLCRLGLFDQALAAVDRSNELFEMVHEKRTIVANQVNASFVKLHAGDALAAKRLALSALELARDIAYPVFEAGALSSIGNAERHLGELDAAIEHIEASIAIRRPIQEPGDFVDDLSDLSLAYVEAGRRERALAVARELHSIGSKSFDGAFWPHYAWWATARGLRRPVQNGKRPTRSLEHDRR